MQVRPEKVAQVDAAARRLLANRPRYLGVSSRTGVPWFLIAALHERESGANFSAHLHEGSPLTGRTLHEPRGRPVSPDPPYSWETSAIDALTMRPHELNKVTNWSIERICYEAERYNGFGYQKRGVRSPYVWSYSNIYTAGKYVRDGQFDPGTVDKQCGVMPIVKRLSELDQSIRFDGGAIVPGGVVSAPPPPQSAPLADPVLQLIIDALLAGKAPASPQATQDAPIHSPIDQLIGGQALAGLKTAIAIVAYALLEILQANGSVSGDSSATQIMKILIIAFGALGMISKFDRIAQSVARVAEKKAKDEPGK